jgi:quinol monooxygenase YgiN
MRPRVNLEDFKIDFNFDLRRLELMITQYSLRTQKEDYKMGLSPRLIIAAIALMLSFSQFSNAQDNSPAYMVTYIEVAPFSTEEVAQLLTTYAQSNGAADGNMHFQALQRIGRPSHFALIETWRDEATRDTHANSVRAANFNESLEPFLYSPTDARPHGDLATAAVTNTGPNGIFAVTHVDVTPTNTDIAVELLNTLATASRRDNGNARFDVLVQLNRRNHMTVVEAWQAPDAQETHYGAEHTKAFRTSLFPLSGALYDERLYRSL